MKASGESNLDDGDGGYVTKARLAGGSGIQVNDSVASFVFSDVGVAVNDQLGIFVFEELEGRTIVIAGIEQVTVGHADAQTEQRAAPLLGAAGCGRTVHIAGDGDGFGDFLELVEDEVVADVAGVEDLGDAVEEVVDAAIEEAVGV